MSLFKFYLFLLGWFFIGITAHLNIIPLDGTVNNRWFYFPFIGLLGIFGIGFSLFNIKKENIKIFLTISAIIIITLLGFRTLIHNPDWYSTYSLASADPDKNNYFIQQDLGIELYNRNKIDEAKKAFIRSNNLFPNPTALSSLGVLYMGQNDPKKAEESLYSAVKYNTLDAYVNLAFILSKNHKSLEAKNIINKGLKSYPKNNQLWILLALAEYNLKNYKEATQAAYKAYSLSPNSANQDVYNRLKNNLPIDNLFKF